ncbi:MAG: hypothetical protein WCR21_06335 [Bacteroidota bacterium]
MKLSLFGIAVTLACFLAGCFGKSPIKRACTQEARAGLNIIVKDSQSNLFLHDSLSIIAGSGTYTESLENFPGSPPTFSGAWEREGTYTVSIKRPRYQSFVTSPIVVTKDECHVIPLTQTISLVPR